MNNVNVPVVHCDTFQLSDEPVGSSNVENLPPSENKKQPDLMPSSLAEGSPKKDIDRLVTKEFKITIPDVPHSIPYVDVVEDYSLRPPKEPIQVVDKRKCRFCNQKPCILDQGLYDLLTGVDFLYNAEYVRANGKSIWYDMYSKSTHFIHGPLPKGRRIKLPTCVVGAIHDIAMEDDPRNYVGFQESS